MRHRSWKRAESRVASALGGRRVPVSGRGRGDTLDVAHDRLSKSTSVFLAPRSWFPERLRGWIGGHHEVLEAMQGQAAPVLERKLSNHEAETQDFPPVDPDQARALLAVVYQGICAALALNAELAAALPEGQNQEAHQLNDSMFVALNDVKQRLEQVIGGS